MTIIHPCMAVGASLTTLVSFNGTNGSNPSAGLMADANGNLYGTTVRGGANGYGTVFEVAAGTNTLTTLVSFNGTNGGYPTAGLIADANGNLYGTTKGGGNGYGTVYEIAAGTNALTTLVSFNDTNGSYPAAGLIADAKGNLFGTTTQGGANGNYYGTVFKVAAGTNALTTLVTFNLANGAGPYAGLIADADGNLYGTTSSGGAQLYGTVFEIAAGTNALTTLVSFSLSGLSPLAGLIADANGNLYGTTYFGGANGYGSVFEIAAGTHALTTLVSFNGANGSYPLASLITDANGNLYGTTSQGGTNGYGTVFEIAAGTHALTTLVSFNGTNGSYPKAGLIADADGNLFGTTSGVFSDGTAISDGTVYKITGSGFVVPEAKSLLMMTFASLGLLGNYMFAKRRAGR